MTRPEILLVDWLGRGGIAHTTVAWEEALKALGWGYSPLVVTRGGRELSHLVRGAVTVSSNHGPIVEHAKLVGAVAARIRATRPAWVVLSGSVLPHLELAVLLAARTFGTKVCCVAHEPAAPRQLPLADDAMRVLWRLSDAVVVHSDYVARLIERTEPRAKVLRVAHPKTQCLVEAMEGRQPLIGPGDGLLALTFGQLQKSYKGADLISEIADRSPEGWRFALVGSGIPAGLSPKVECREGFFEAGELAATVAAADVVLLPYRRASQSGAVVLAQEVGTPVVASAVGGISEQILHGRNGLLVSPGAGPEEWVTLLGRLADRSLRERLSSSALADLDEQNKKFCGALEALFD